MAQQSSDIIEEKNTFPLRIFGDSGKHYLVCPYESTYDNLVASFLDGDQRIVHFDVESSTIDPPFKRHFLYSKAGERRLVTSSGYLFDGIVDVHFFNADAPQYSRYSLSKYERESLDIFPFIELYHVRGDKNNKTGGLENAVKEHMRRIDGLKVDNLTIKEAMEFYDAMRNHVPRY